MPNFKIVSTKQAQEDLQAIFDYWKTKSVSGAQSVIIDIISSTKKIYFARQYQIDDINPNYRRVIVRSDYIVLYREEGENIYIVGIFNTKQSPEN